MKRRSRLLRFIQWASVFVLCILASTYAVSSRFRTLAHGIAAGRFTGVQYIGGPGERIVLSSDPRIIGDWFPGADETPLVVLVHGSTLKGRRDGLIQLLACGLQRRGVSVLSVDLPGFGDSADPSMPLDDDFRFDDAVLISVNEAIKRKWAKQGRIVYLGYSLGGGVVLRAGRIQPKPSAIIAIGAPCLKSQFSELGDQYRRRFAWDRFQDMAIEPDPKSVEIMAQYLEQMDAAEQISVGHLPPVLLIYGERERFPISILQAQTESKDTRHELKIITNAGHGFYVYSLGEAVQVYNRRMLKELLDCIESRSSTAPTQ